MSLARLVSSHCAICANPEPCRLPPVAFRWVHTAMFMARYTPQSFACCRVNIDLGHLKDLCVSLSPTTPTLKRPGRSGLSAALEKKTKPWVTPFWNLWGM